MSKTYFGAINYEIHPDIELDYTLNRIFREMSLSELETLHHLCELERTQILQSLALAVFKILYAGYLLSSNRFSFLDYEEKQHLVNTPALKKFHQFMFLKTMTTHLFLGYS